MTQPDDQHDDRPDDLSTWEGDDLVRALRTPGTATELADEERYLAAFRDAGGSTVRSLPRRAAGRLGAGGTAVVVTVALTSGVAAAYTGHLPDPVQQIAHTVIGAPAPDGDGRHRPDASGPRVGPESAGSGGPSTAPSNSATSGPTSGPAGGPTGSGSSSPSAAGHHHRRGQVGASSGPSDGPSSGPTSTPTGSSGGAASAMTMSAPTHRVDLGQTVTLTCLVTDASGAALAGQPVVLQARGPRHWRRVLDTTTDSSGLAAATTPAITRTVKLRWKADRGVTSTPWLVRMVPVVAVTADVGGTTTTLAAAAQGSAPGDRVQVYRHLAGRTVLVRRARLDASGSASIAVRTPRRRATYAVRLLPTRRHAAAAARVVVVPPAPAGLTIDGSASRVVVDGTAVIGGTVTSATGDVLPGRRVVLLRRGPARWKPVGQAVTDAAGHVSIATPPIAATTRFRLRTDQAVHSTVWRIVELPRMGASASRSTDTVSIAAAVTGARAGDRVVLLRRVGGRLVRMRHGPLDASGSVIFVVPARATRTTYVVRLGATQRHGPASAAVTVPGA